MQRIGTRMLIGLTLLLAGVLAHAAPNEPDTRGNLVGSWRLVSATYGNPGGKEGRDWIHYVPEGMVHLKHITPTHFTVVTYEVPTKKVTIVGGGRYSLRDGAYKETVEFAMGRTLPELLGKEQSFSLKLEGDRWTHSGTLTNGQRIEEVWELVK
jgi:hypothetical protein